MFFDITHYKENMAFIQDDGEKATYGDVLDCVTKFTDFEMSRSLIFILCENSIGSIAGYISCFNNRSVPLLLSSRIDERLLDNLIMIYKPVFLWIPNHVDVKVKTVKIYEAWNYSLLQTTYSSEKIFDELALLLTTSGSTGSPRLVRQSYGNIKANTESIIEYLKLDSTERPITTLPMNYTYGLSIINTHVYVGATILLTDKGLMQKEFWQFLKERKATSFGGVPYTYEMLDRLRFYSMDLPNLRAMTQAGGKLTAELHEKFAKYAEDNGKEFVVMYGQCEATARMGYLPAEKAVEKKGSMGVAIPGGKFRLIDAVGNYITVPYTTGELVYEGENVTLGYAEKASDLAKGDERNGILETGDMAQFDEDGYYYIVGRKNRFLKIYGNRVNLDEMDMIIKSKYEIEIACTGVDDHMYIFLTEDSYADEIREYVSKTTKLNPVAFKTVVIPEIPKNNSGKTKYTDLEKYYDI